jgi:hypothetical protein
MRRLSFLGWALIGLLLSSASGALVDSSRMKIGASPWTKKESVYPEIKYHADAGLAPVLAHIIIINNRSAIYRPDSCFGTGDFINRSFQLGRQRSDRLSNLNDDSNRDVAIRLGYTANGRHITEDRVIAHVPGVAVTQGV